MKCASGINQYRLHKGYHYPRSKDTALECLVGINTFKKKYEDTVVNGDIQHFYSISSEDSLITGDDYINFLNDIELKYNIHEPNMGTQLTVSVDEQLFDSDKLKDIVERRMLALGVEKICNKKTIKKTLKVMILLLYLHILN